MIVLKIIEFILAALGGLVVAIFFHERFRDWSYGTDFWGYRLKQCEIDIQALANRLDSFEKKKCK